MKNRQYIVLTMLFLLNFPTLATAASLDEMYRDIVKSDNHGYLPMYVKNRNHPEALLDDSEVKAIPATAKDAEIEDITINLINERKLRDAAEKAAILKWENTIKAVQENKVTAVELEEITLRVQKDDPKATEILAWMNVNSVGVQANLVEAFKLYQKAVFLKVPQAAENAQLVYKALNREQIEQLKQHPNEYLEEQSTD